MSTNMKTQIRGYVSQMDEDQAPIDVSEVLALTEPVRELPPPPKPAEFPVRLQITRRRGLRWGYGMAAAVMALLLVGGAAWLTRSTEESESRRSDHRHYAVAHGDDSPDRDHGPDRDDSPDRDHGSYR